MALTQKGICDFGWKARDFALKGVDGKTYSLADVCGPKGVLVVFICNHCPYVKASIGRIVLESPSCRMTPRPTARTPTTT
jgi:peroxiredoxin